jgi:hypothetical protein
MTIITLIIDTPSGMTSPAPVDIVKDLPPGEYKPDGKGGWRQVKRAKQKEEDE